MIISHAMKYLADNGIGSVTFGVAGSDELKSAGNVSGVRMKLLAKSYNSTYPLTLQRSDSTNTVRRF